ncbi:MAG: fatty acid desaturase [Bacteriovoracaceae bacterium]|nr:fatty acid desaturase [Bacteriovoracaceae bacterium]
MARGVYLGKEITIPGTLNIFIALSAYSLAILCLYFAATSNTLWTYLISTLCFSYIGNTLFSLLHESVHRVFHPNKTLNDLFGVFSAAFFPTGFTLQRAFHLGHHRRNRTDVEMFDMYYPSDSKLLKRLQMYTILLGFYWTSAPIAGLAYLFAPWLLNIPLLRSPDPRIQRMSADAMLSGIEKVNPLKARAELLFTLLFHLALGYFMGLSFWKWLGCYWAFAINWGSLQYADHAWTKRDIRHGAWNLKVNPIVHWIFLHYHHHKSHHENPQVPWIHLHKFVDFKEERPTHFSIWLKMWKGPTLTQESSPKALDKSFEDALYESPQ